ncbi:MAG TPA: HAMP domain-containing sensor histidine kinase [Ktedonobacteraceae bacterium]|nr:HAMP domain-containing sensor histidine kinase [Ktedonobacteraceae bacterium]
MMDNYAPPGRNELVLHELEQQLRDVEQRCREMQREIQHLREMNQLKDQFLMMASHELRTPLTSVQGYLELMAEYQDELSPERCRAYLQKAQRSCEELVMLFGNVMDVSRLDEEMHPAQMETVSVQKMIESVMYLIEPRVLKEQREIQLHIPPRLQVRANPGRLRQALLNISINALKYSPPQSPIIFAARVDPDSNNAVDISITDMGRGIAPPDQARVFQLYERLERDVQSAVQGSGLGLYISNLFIEAMGGKIWIESEGIAGQGATFHMQLPA